MNGKVKELENKEFEISFLGVGTADAIIKAWSNIYGNEMTKEEIEKIIDVIRSRLIEKR